MNIIERLVGLYAPHMCSGCGNEGDALCTACIRRLPRPDRRCYVCHAPSPAGLTCLPCRQESGTALLAVNAASRYEGVAKDIVWQLKFNRAQAAADDMARLMAALCRQRVRSDTLIVPVPTARSRVRMRGYDQASLLARAVARRSGATFAPLLVRNGKQRQVGASLDQRKIQMRGAYSVPSPQRLQGRHIILIDDVVTTGSTLEAAAGTLRASGSGPVEALVFAQAAD
jgi:ComF family protein